MNQVKKFDHRRIEAKWQKKWEDSATYTPQLLHSNREKFYNLMMFPYPSAEGLHVGSMYAFSGADVYGRIKRMQGYDVFEPMGLDGFGIHSENFAIKSGRHPKKHAEISEKNFYKQLASIGNGFAWDHRLETYDPDYYRWTQWLFIKLFEAGLAYRDTAIVNWCPFDKTVLADEQVEDGKCERCKNNVERREMSSWFFKITDYADKLLDNLEKIDWPEKIKIAQKQWIGKKTGINITYKIKDTNDKDITVFTTRPETNFGATFVVVAPEYAKDKLLGLVPDKYHQSVSKYIDISLNKSEQDRKIGEKDKSGEFTGLYAINPLNNYQMPIYVADYVLMDFGTGAVVGVPGHDKRDFEFAKAQNLDIERVIIGNDGETGPIDSIEKVVEGDGKIINSEFLNGMKVDDAIDKIMQYIEDNEYGERTTTYHLRDWGISRQRYWGAPIPMINCDKCGWVPEKEENLPVVLPDIKDFKPKGDGTTPLENAPDEWKFTACPKCGQKAKRELEVADTFLDSSWYFLAFPNLHTDEYNRVIANETKQPKKDRHADARDDKITPFNQEITKRWFPVDAYIGGAEHAVLHLLYSRFIWMVLSDQDLLPKELGDEPFPFLFGHGLIIKDGSKMSKSKGNVINPDEYIEKYGADTLRMYLMFLGPYDGGGDFRDSGIEGMRKFIDKLWNLLNTKDIKIHKNDIKDVRVKLHKTIKKVTEDLNQFKYNTAIAALMELVNVINEKIDSDAEEKDLVSQKEIIEIYKLITQLIAPIAPHVAEELWVEVFNQDFSVHNSKWPEYDEELTISDHIEVAVQVNGKHRSTLTLEIVDASDEQKVIEAARSDKQLEKWIGKKEAKKIIFVPGKIINFVI